MQQQMNVAPKWAGGGCNTGVLVFHLVCPRLPPRVCPRLPPPSLLRCHFRLRLRYSFLHYFWSVARFPAEPSGYFSCVRADRRQLFDWLLLHGTEYEYLSISFAIGTEELNCILRQQCLDTHGSSPKNRTQGPWAL